MSGLDALHLRLEDFEGPLPLLLHLIEKNQLEVTRVSVAAVADQFLAVVEKLGAADLSTTGEFVAAAARLLLIKSRALLFRPVTTGAEADEQDDAELLARQIAEYARFKKVALVLGGRLEGDLVTWPRPAGVHAGTPAVQAPHVAPLALHRAARRLLFAPAREEVAGDPWPDIAYGSLRSELLAEVRRMKRTSFAALVAGAWHPLVVITMFLALLDAVRVQQVQFSQPVTFGPISVSLVEATENHA